MTAPRSRHPITSLARERRRWERTGRGRISSADRSFPSGEKRLRYGTAPTREPHGRRSTADNGGTSCHRAYSPRQLKRRPPPRSCLPTAHLGISPSGSRRQRTTARADDSGERFKRAALGHGPAVRRSTHMVNQLATLEALSEDECLAHIRTITVPPWVPGPRPTLRRRVPETITGQRFGREAPHGGPER